MPTIIEALLSLATAPANSEAFGAWIEQQDTVAFLRANAQDDELVVYASLPHVYIHAVSIPASRVEPPDVDDLLSWNFGAYDSWSTSLQFRPPAISIEPPLSHTSSKTMDGGEKLIFPRTFQGLIGDKTYYEPLQAFLHLFDLHFVRERAAYCRLDQRGDLEDFIRIVPLGDRHGHRNGTAVVFRRHLLNEWMALTESAIIQMFDFTRLRLSEGTDWDLAERQRVVDGDLIYRQARDASHASYMRGVHIVRPQMTKEDLIREQLGQSNRNRREYVSFLAHDFKNKTVREISTAPDATANYFTESDLPFETSPVFFRPEVLQKYKADRDKYRLDEWSISCRGTWSLQTYDINEAGQVHTYIV